MPRLYIRTSGGFYARVLPGNRQPSGAEVGVALQEQ